MSEKVCVCVSFVVAKKNRTYKGVFVFYFAQGIFFVVSTKDTYGIIFIHILFFFL